LFIDSSGRLGVGTSSPAGTLNVQGSTAAPSLTYDTANLVNLDAGTIQLAIGINSSPPFGAYLQGRATNDAARVISLNPAGGDVGVGTANPAVALHVATTGTPQFRLEDLDTANAYSNVSASNGNFVIQADPQNVSGSTRIGFEIDGSERARIDSSGRLGVGTSSINANVQIQGTSAAPAASGSMNSGIVYQTGAGTRALNIGVDGTNNYAWINSAYENNSGTAADTGLRLMVGATSAIAIDSSQRVGIGTTSPGAPLEVVGSTNGDQFRINQSGQYYRIGREGSGGLLEFYGAQSGFNGYIFSGANGERARIDSSGRLLVGTSTYTGNGKVAIAGGTGTNIALLDLRYNSTRPSGADTGLAEIRFGAADHTSNNAYAKIEAVTDGASSSDADLPGRLVFSTTADGASSPTERMRIASDGAFYVQDVYDTTTVNAANVEVNSNGRLRRSTSSAKYKTNVQTLEDSYADAILNCRPVWYQSLCNGDNPDYGYWGFIAEEVAEIDPRLVFWKTVDISHDKKGSPVETPCDPQPEGVFYDRFVPHLLNLIKRQQQAIETLEAKVAALEAG
jgi:hypothetical protein